VSAMLVLARSPRCSSKAFPIRLLFKRALYFMSVSTPVTTALNTAVLQHHFPPVHNLGCGAACIVPAATAGETRPSVPGASSVFKR
jgi:hypothetical protein